MASPGNEHCSDMSVHCTNNITVSAQVRPLPWADRGLASAENCLRVSSSNC